MVHVIPQGLFQFRHTAEDAVAQPIVRQVAEPTFDHVQPRARCGREVPVEPGMSLEPSVHFGVLVRGVVVDDQVPIEIGRRLGIDLLQELDPFLVPVPAVQVRNDPAFGQFDRGEQCRRAMPPVVVGQRLQSAGEHRQAFLRAVQSLNLALFIARQHQRTVRRIEIQPHDVEQFLDEFRIIGRFEAFRAMRLEVVVAPDPLHRVLADAHRFGERARGPLRGVRRRFLRCQPQNLGLFRPAHRRCAAAARGIPFDARQTIVRKTIAPGAHRPPRATEFRSDVPVLATVRCGQHDLGTQNQPGRRAPSARPLRQRDSLLTGQQNRFRNAHGFDPPVFKDQTPADSISSLDYATLH